MTKLFVDPLAEMYIIGTTIDYINEDINNGIFESKFVYNVDAKNGVLLWLWYILYTKESIILNMFFNKGIKPLVFLT